MICTNCAELIEALEAARGVLFWNNTQDGRKAFHLVDAALKKAKGEQA